MKVQLNKQLILENDLPEDDESPLGFGAGVLGTLGGLAAGAALLKRKAIKNGVISGINKATTGIRNKYNDTKEQMAAKLDPEAAKAKADAKKDTDFEAQKKAQEKINNDTIKKEDEAENEKYDEIAKERKIRLAKEARAKKPNEIKLAKAKNDKLNALANS